MEESFRAYRRNLPHWRTAGATYYVTWHLAAEQLPLTSKEKDAIRDALLHFDVQRYELAAYVVMDDHVHVLAMMMDGWALERIVHSWKSFTAHVLANDGRKTPIWQAEYYDRIVRNQAEFEQKANYILDNPRRQWPDIEHYVWVSE